MSLFGHCKACSTGKSEFELATAANAAGEFDFDLTGLSHARAAVPIRP